MLTIKEIADKISAHTPEHCRAKRTAVLVPLLDDGGQIEVLFEVRSFDLKWQPGDICFPGGHYEASDEGLQETVVRETCEELGISAEKVRILGKIGAFDSPLGMEVHIYAGMLDCTLADLRVDRNEVHECFTAPLRWFMDNEPRRACVEHGTKPGDDFPFDLLGSYNPGWKTRCRYPALFYNYDGRIIWGLTAEVLWRFLEVIREGKANGAGG